MTRAGPFARYAAHMLQGGYSPIPVQWESKKPFLKGWPELGTKPLTPEKIAQLASKYPALGIAVAGGYNGLVPIDCDTDDEEIRAAIASAIPAANVTKAGRRGFVGFYRSGGKIQARKFRTPGRQGKVICEILTTGKTVLPPSIHPETRKPYRWLTAPSTLYSVRLPELVLITRAHIAALEKALRPWVPPPEPYVPPPAPKRRVADKRMRAWALSALQGEAAKLAVLAKDSGRNIGLFNAARCLGKYVHHGVIDGAEVEAAMMKACRANGLLVEDGKRACLATLLSGFKLARGEALPLFGDRRQ